MLTLAIKLRDLLSHEEGQDLVEYALIISVIALASIAGVGTFSSAVNSAWEIVVQRVITAFNGSSS